MSWGTPVVRGHVFNTTNGATLAIASVAFTTDRLYVSFYTSEGTGGIYDHSTMAITGQTGSWTFISQTASGIGANARRISAWYYIATATETVTVTYDPPSGSKACHAASIIEIPSGFDSTTPIAQNTPSEDATGGATFAVNLTSAPSASNMSMVGVMNRGNSFAIGVDGGFTAELSDDVGSGTSTDSGDLETSYKTAATQNCTVSAGSGSPVWGGIHLELAAAATGSAITDTDAGTLTDARSLTGEAIPSDGGTLTDNRSLTGEASTADAATVSELAIASITQDVVDTDAASLSEAVASSIQGIPGDAGTLAESATDVLDAVTADAGTLAEVWLGNVAETAADAGILTETPALGADLITADAGTLTETESASQAGLGGGPATDTDFASLAEQAIAELLASVSDSVTSTDLCAPVGVLGPSDSGALTESLVGVANLVAVDAWTLSESESATGPAPTGTDSETFTFGDEAVVSYRFPSRMKGTRLMRHGRGTWLISR